jgi:hypothetical protein
MLTPIEMRQIFTAISTFNGICVPDSYVKVSDVFALLSTYCETPCQVTGESLGDEGTKWTLSFSIQN